ncbi:uncharacterized protein [Spinacia oleracea]|uniref:DDE Tnp4 domain-containing protein n=1 Tax=Spinacia oleracea TaxID=3562 RepID=A0ABM3QQC9_SPIOL|nr:uncharacterized protein LOC130461474 [Spinacia oleracea]
MANQVPRAPRVLVQRNRDDGNDRLWNDYFTDQPVFPPSLFRRRFRMKKHVFLPMRLLAYGTAADNVEDYLRISSSLARYSLQHFVEGTVLKGLFSGRANKPTLILEAVASQDLWIWHAFLGTPGRCNDINVLDRSPLFTDVFEGREPPINYVVNGHQYSMGYNLTDGICPKSAAFIPTISLPQNEKEGLFAKLQESRRKDVERAFGVLQARFAIIRQPALARNTSMLGKIMIACIIIHNMIVEDERDTYLNYKDPSEYDQAVEQPSSSNRRNNGEPFQFHNGAKRIANLDTYMSNRVRVRDEVMHRALKSDLVEHLWLKYGGNNREEGNNRE